MSAFPRRRHGEDCGVIAVYRRTGPAAELAHRGLFALQHRGQEAAGIATWGPSGEIHHLKGRGLVSECLPTYRVGQLPGSLAVAHVRYSTVAADRSENIQPFLATTPFGKLAIAHNGNLKNADEMQKLLEAKGSLLSTTMDTELMVHLMARSEDVQFEGALRFMAKRVRGAYSLTMLCDGRLYGLRDPYGVRPLVIGKMADGWVIASETCALRVLDADYIGEVRPGELVEIGPEGVVRQKLLEAATRPAPCVFELVYFARPNSEVFGQGVQGARIRMGEHLAIQDEMEGIEPPDIVVPIPDSGVPAAIGYARRSGVLLEMAILRSHYAGGAFITQVRYELVTDHAHVRGVFSCVSIRWNASHSTWYPYFGIFDHETSNASSQDPTSFAAATHRAACCLGAAAQRVADVGRLLMAPSQGAGIEDVRLQPADSVWAALGARRCWLLSLTAGRPRRTA
ncbi:MAG: hypothetical protein V3T05_13805, partial [Myxococcota bacterium]